jgi:hypothetical protein
MFGGQLAGIGGDLELPNNWMFLRILVTTLTTLRDLGHLKGGEPAPAMYHMDNDLTLPGRGFVPFCSGLGCWCLSRHA